MPVKRIILLDRLSDREIQWGDQAPQFWHYVLWADVPVSRQPFYATASDYQSAVVGIAAPDLTALRTGAVVERLGVLQIDKGSTIPQLQAQLQAEWTAFQNGVTNRNPWARYGTFWDGTSWTVGGVA